MLKKLMIIMITILISFLLMSTNAVFASISFDLVETGTGNSSKIVTPGEAFDLDVIALSVNAETSTKNELDAFTYRIVFENEEFTLASTEFYGPYNNAKAPFGYNGSIPWLEPGDPPLLIENDVDFGSPGYTSTIADLYRTTASDMGIPVPWTSGDAPINVEHDGYLAPLTPGDYTIGLEIIEAVDTMGSSHGVDFEGSFDLTVVPIPSSLTLFSLGVAFMGFLKRRSQ